MYFSRIAFGVFPAVFLFLLFYLFQVIPHSFRVNYNQLTIMKRYRNFQIWDFEQQIPVRKDSNNVILGLDGGTTTTVCICIPFSSDHHHQNTNILPEDRPPVLARAFAGCSNHNSVGGFHSIFNILESYVVCCIVDFFLTFSYMSDRKCCKGNSGTSNG